MASVASSEMSDQRALLTETERKILSGEKEVKDNYRYSVESRVRTRLRNRFSGDVELLRENQPEMFEILEETVCEDVEEEDIATSDSPEDIVEPVVESERTDTEAKEDIYDGLAGQIEVEERVWDVIEDVAEGWDDDDRLHNRKQAAAEVLQHAVETGDPVGRSSEIVEEVREKYPVAGQNKETYWRKNIRDVLSEVGDYSRGSHKYTVNSLDQGGEDDE